MKTLKHYLILGLLTLTSSFLFGQTKVEKEVIERADKSFSAGRYLDALEDYRLLLSNSPENTEYNFRYGACLLASDEPVSDAVKHLSYAASNGCEDVRVFHFLGKAYHLDYRFSDALANYGRFEQEAETKVKNEHGENSRLMVMAENGKQLLSSMKDIRVMEKTESTVGDFFRNYGLQDIGGNVITVPDELLSSTDKKQGHRPLMYYRDDMSMLFFSSYGRNGDNLDIYTVSPLPDGSFSIPMILGNGVNTPFDEDYPFLHSDGRTLYFSSKGHSSMGGYDIFSSSRDLSTGGFNEAENLDFAISSPDDDLFYVVDKDRETAYFASTRNSEDGRLHVYKVKVKASDSELALLVGNIKNETGGMSAASIKVMDARTNELIGTYSTDTNGDYMIDLPGQGKYKFFIDMTDSELTHTGLVDIPSFGAVKAFKQEMSLTEVGAQEKLVITNRFDEELDMDVLALAQQVLKDKARLEVNTTEEELLAEEEEEAVFTPEDVLAKSGFRRDDGMEKVMELAYEQERSMAEALARDKEEARIARSTAADAMSRSEAALKDLDTFMQLYETTSDVEAKEEFLIEAAFARQDAESSLEEMISALTLARSIEGQEQDRKMLREQLSSRNSLMEEAIEKEKSAELVEVFKDVKSKDDRGMQILDALDVTAMEASERKGQADKLADLVKTTQQRRDEALSAIESKELQRERVTKRKDREMVDQEILALESELDDYKRQLERDIPKLESLKEEDRSWTSAVHLLERIRLEPDELPIVEQEWAVDRLDEQRSFLALSLEEHSISEKELARITASRPDLLSRYDVASLDIRGPEEESSATMLDLAEQLDEASEELADGSEVLDGSDEGQSEEEGIDSDGSTGENSAIRSDNLTEGTSDDSGIRVEEGTDEIAEVQDLSEVEAVDNSKGDNGNDVISEAEDAGFNDDRLDGAETRDDFSSAEIAELTDVESSDDQGSDETRTEIDGIEEGQDDDPEDVEVIVEEGNIDSLDEESGLESLKDSNDASTIESSPFQGLLSEWEAMGPDATDFFRDQMPDGDNVEVYTLQPDRSDELKEIWSTIEEGPERLAAVQELDGELYERIISDSRVANEEVDISTEDSRSLEWLESRYDNLSVLVLEDAEESIATQKEGQSIDDGDQGILISDESVITLDGESRERLLVLAEEADFKEATESHLLGLEKLMDQRPISASSIENRMERHVQFRDLLEELKGQRTELLSRSEDDVERSTMSAQIESLEAMVVQKERQMQEELTLWQQKFDLDLTETQRTEVMAQGSEALRTIISLEESVAEDSSTEARNDLDDSTRSVKESNTEDESGAILEPDRELRSESTDESIEYAPEPDESNSSQLEAQGFFSLFFDDLHPLSAIDAHIERLYYSDDFGLITDGIEDMPDLDAPLTSMDMDAEVDVLESLGPQGALAIERRLANLDVVEQDKEKLTEVQAIYEEAVELRKSAASSRDRTERRVILREAVLKEMTALDALDELIEQKEFVESGGEVEDFRYDGDISSDIMLAKQATDQLSEDEGLTDSTASQEDEAYIDIPEDILPSEEVVITLPEELDALEVPDREEVMNDYKGVAFALTNADILPVLPLDDALQLMEIERESISVRQTEGLAPEDLQVLEDIRFESKRLDEYEVQLKKDRSAYVDALEERQIRWAEVIDVLEDDSDDKQAKKQQSRLLAEMQVIRSYLTSSEADLAEIEIRRSGLMDQEDAYLANKALALTGEETSEDVSLADDETEGIESLEDRTIETDEVVEYQEADPKLPDEEGEYLTDVIDEEVGLTEVDSEGTEELDAIVVVDSSDGVSGDELGFEAVIPETAPITLEENILRIAAPDDAGPRERKEYDRIPDGLVYQVQVGAFRNLVSAELFSEFQPIITETLSSGITRYKAGLFLDESSAQKAKKTIRAMGYADAFIVVYMDGERISLTEARAGMPTEFLADESGLDDVGTTTDEQEELIETSAQSADITAESFDAVHETEMSNETIIDTKTLEGKADGSYYDVVPDAAPATQVETIKGLFYTVQVGVYSKPVTSDNIFDISPLNSELMESGLIKYTSGIFDDIDLARTWKDEVVVKGVGDAFVTAYLDGRRIPLDEAVSLYLDEGEEVFASIDSLDAIERDREAEAVWSMIATSDLFREDVEKYVGFKIRLGPYYDRIPDRDVKVILDFEDRVSFSEREDGGIEYTTLGDMTYEESQGWRKTFLERGVTNATIVAVKEGEEIPLKQALEFLLK